MVTDSHADAVRITPSGAEDRLVLIDPGDTSEQGMLLASTLRAFASRRLGHFAGGVAAQEGIEADESGFYYPGDDFDPGEVRFEGVKVFNPLGEVEVSVDAFERVALRFLLTCRDEATARGSSIQQESWWPAFLASCDQISGRVAKGGPTSP